MQTHIQEAYNFLDEHLPFSYAKETQEHLKSLKIDISLSVIRNVRIKKTTTNVVVLNALLKVARKHKKEEKLLKDEIAV